MSRHGDWIRIDVPGGYLRWSKSVGALDAHCSTHTDEGVCKADFCMKRNRGVGRAIGRQLLWLELGSRRCSTRSDRNECKRDVGSSHFQKERQECRSRLLAQSKTDPLLRSLFEHEPDNGRGFAFEPPKVP